MLERHNYTVKLWADDEALELITAKYAWLLQTYKEHSLNIQRADIARLLVVHTEGGIYSDLDVYPRSAEHIQCVQHLGLQAIFSPTTGTLGLSNHFFMARCGSPFLQWVLYEAPAAWRQAIVSTCSRAILEGLLVYRANGVDSSVSKVLLAIRHTAA